MVEIQIQDKKYEILFKESTIKNWVSLIEELN